MAPTAPIDPKLLEILRCPVAVHYTDKGDDPGKLELVRGTWLYCADSGYKYPIIDGIPKMLIEEGAKWKDTEVDDLPVPPPNDTVYATAEAALTPEMQQLAADLTARADTTRDEAISKLRETAKEIRQQANSAEGEGIARQAEAIAGGLDNAADLLNGHAPSTPAPTAATNRNWMMIAMLFVLGLVVGLLMRGRGNRD
jgi:uncharacterized protein